MYTNILFTILIIYSALVLIYFLVLNSTYFVLLILATTEMIYENRKPEFGVCKGEACDLAPSISILVPAYNEKATIAESISALQKLDYPQLEIVIINDGSTDTTMPELKKEFKLIKVSRDIKEDLQYENVKQVYKSVNDDRILVIDKENGGKADSLNAGLDYSRSDLFIAIDADSLIEKGGLQSLVQPYIEKDSEVVGIGGIVRVTNNCKIKDGQVVKAQLPDKILPAIQVMEYIRAFLFGRAGWSKINALPIISGAFGLFKTDRVIEVGGYRTDTVGEDSDLVVRLHRLMRDRDIDYEIAFKPDPVCWTQVPESLKILGRQRNRWERGLIETLTYHPKMIGNPKYGSLGILALPHFLLFEMLGPIVELTGPFVILISFLMGWLDVNFALLFLGVTVMYGLLISLWSLTLEEFITKRYEKPMDRIKLIGTAILENFGYRQLHSYWRLKGIFDFLRKENSWGEMERETFDSSEKSSTETTSDSPE